MWRNEVAERLEVAVVIELYKVQVVISIMGTVACVHV